MTRRFWKKLRNSVAEILKNNGAQAAQNRQQLSMEAPGLKDTRAHTPGDKAHEPRWDTPECSRTYLEVIPQGLEVLVSLQEKGPPRGVAAVYQELQKPWGDTDPRGAKAQP